MSIARRYVAGAGAARSVIAAGAALVSVCVVSAGPVAAPLPTHRVSTQTYTLVASSALLNVPVNLFDMALSVPAWELQAMNRLADAMIGTGSWQVWGPTNVFGLDEWDPPKLAGVIDMTMPVQPFSSVLGDQINWWAKANAPMTADCAATPGACPDFGAAASGYLKVAASKLFDGYQFPTVTNPFTLQQTSWSGQYIKLDPGAAFTSLWNYLTSEPTGVQTAPIGDYFTLPLKLATSVFNAYYPFVQNSEWFNPQTPFSWAFRALAPITCPSCGPEPYDNPWLYQNYPPKPAATRTTPAPAATVDSATVVSATVDRVVSATVDTVVAVAPAVDLTVDRVDVTGPAPSMTNGGATGHRGPFGADRSPAGTAGIHGKTRGHSGPSDQA